MRVLVVDDEAPARSEVAFLLAEDGLVAHVQTAADAAEAFRILEQNEIDVVFCDIKMPALSGLELARVLTQFKHPPQVVFITAYDEHAVDAFELHATDYLMKPVRPERISEAVRRVVEAGSPLQTPDANPGDETIAVELAGVTRFVQRSDVRYVEAAGDYARLHTTQDSHLVRVPLTVLADRWAESGFVRIHRSTLVSLDHIDEVRTADGHCTVQLGHDVLQVSRRHTRELRDRIVRARELGRDGRDSRDSAT
ncbi:MAG TPA: LytTR family DNA-binding domain-containing protein [Jatrophihabitans sp.]